MKKTIVIISCLLVIFAVSVVFANEFTQISEGGNTIQIAGLQEKTDALFIKNNFTQEQLDAMDKKYIEYFDDVFWNSYLPGMKQWGKIDPKQSDESVYADRLSRAKADYDNGVLVSLLVTDNYSKQYAQEKSFLYLFSEQTYWAVPTIDAAIAHPYFAANGNFISSSAENGGYNLIFGISNEGINFIKDTKYIENILLKYGETKVSDMKLFTISDLMILLYIRCDDGEYIIKLSDTGASTSDAVFPQIEHFMLYPASEIMELILSGGGRAFPAKQNMADRIATTKPTYAVEGEALMAEGLIQGNEKSLDPLKPLTRIEAVAMLLRAIGEPTTAPEGAEQIFSDVPGTHWGFGTAKNAYDLGLIKGVGDGKFAPNALVTDNQFATMVLRAADTEEFDWQQAINMLIESGIITQENAGTMDLFTRGDMAKIIYEAREKGLL